MFHILMHMPKRLMEIDEHIGFDGSNWRFFLLSFLIAILISYTVIESVARLLMARGGVRTIWLLTGATSLGTGFWSLHFIGILILHRDSLLVYDAFLALIALLVATIASGAGLALAQVERLEKWRFLWAGTCMGLGIASMHQISIYALHVGDDVVYSSFLIIMSSLASIVACTLLLWFAFRFQGIFATDKLGIIKKFGSSCVTAGLIVTAYDLALVSATFSVRMPASTIIAFHLDIVSLSSAIGFMAIIILGLVLLASFINNSLSRQNAASESLFLHYPDAVFSLDLAGQIQSANPAAGIMTGYSVDELVQSLFITFVIPEDERRIMQSLAEAARGYSQQYELVMLNKESERLQLNVTNIPIYLRNQIIGIYVFAKDITAQRRAEEERARLITILEATTDVIGTADQLGRVFYCNSAGRQMFGWEPEGSLAHRTITNCYSAATREYMFQVAIPAAARDGVWSGEGSIITYEGEELPISQVIIAHRDANGTVRFVSNIARDISERKRAEEALQAERRLLEKRIEERTAELSAANAELARAARLKDEFLANMSHELRTPLNAILGLSEAMREGIYGELDGEKANALHGIEESGRHLLTLINDILDLSKIEAGKLSLNLDVAYVEEIGQVSLRMIRQAAQQKQLTISASFDSRVPVLWADARRLKQVLVNLLSNAVKFTPPGGMIGLEVRSDQEQQQVYFTVWDTGIGIDSADIPRLFHPFVQVDSSHTRHYEGTGLGLALVSRMVQLHGGSISVETKVGQGSRFTIALPWRVPDDPDELEEMLLLQNTRLPGQTAVVSRKSLEIGGNPVHRQANGGALILLAEDNPANITTFVDYLVAKQYQVIVVNNGREALQCASEAHPDLILMDIQMPGMDGMEAIRCIRHDPQLAHIPIIALTALAMDGDRERCLLIGANDYLSKPISLQQLAATIEGQLVSSRMGVIE